MLDSTRKNQDGSHFHSGESAATVSSESSQQMFFSLLLSISIIILNCLRIPELLFTPRFWAEEGTTYFSSAYSSSFFENVISAHYGYFTLYNNIVTSLATLVNLESAPMVTIYAALAVQIAVSLFIIYGDNPLLPKPYQRYLVAIFVPMVSYAEVWLTTIGIQYWLGIAAFFILTGNRPASRLGIITESVTLILAGLTGVIACLMTPVYLLKAYWQRTKSACLQAGILTLCSFIQVFVFLQAFISKNSEVSDRLTGNSTITVFIKWVAFQCSVPFFGRGLFQYKPVALLGQFLNQSLVTLFGKSVFASEILVVPFFCGLLILIFMVFLAVIQWKKPEIQLSALAFIIVAFFSTILSLKMSGGPRYTFAPSIMVMVILISSLTSDYWKIFTRGTCILLAAAAISFNGYEFWSSTYIAYSKDYPDWRTQVKLWRALGPEYQLKIWPPPWAMSLNNRIN